MSHSSVHSHSHSRSHGGHSHSHEDSPYDQTCQSPTTAASYAFICAFLGALTAVSLPTRIAGYFLPTLPQTITLWLIVTIGFVYSGLTATLFSKVLEEALQADYGSTLRVEYRGGASSGLERKRRVDARGKLTQLKGFSWVAFAMIILLNATSIVLFVLGLAVDAEEWLEFCMTRALLVSAPAEASSSSHQAAREDDPKQDLCLSMALNQAYLVIGIPVILLTVELVRHLKTLAFVTLAMEKDVVELPPQLAQSEFGASTGSWMPELGRKKKNKRVRRREYRSDSEGSVESRTSLLS
ncbi:uncharacterized protein JCM15063_002532 [Sporobolomyces koalae]|uniref:uncharacterized protein n=1 Tax=Sporobolomyces koalae TaxID=500713 RepID=UPI00317D7EEC